MAASVMEGGLKAAPRHHGLALALLIAAVALVHAWVTYEVSEEMKALAPPADEIKRMEASYVAEVRLSKPPTPPAPPKPVPPPPAPTAKKKPKPRPVEAASAPQEVASAPLEEEKPEVLAQAASQAEPAASTPPPIVEAASSAPAAPEPTATGPAFIWPKATRVTYTMEGNYRGPIYGQASVEWVRQEMRYQVRVEASVGPSFAPLGSWKLISEGDIKPEGLSPTRYQNADKLLFKSRAPRTIEFESEEVVLPSGTRVARLPGMQDPASQFIQLAYRFIMNPSLLKVGNTIEMPMVWLKKTETLAYDVIKEETLRTPMGELSTFHVKPRRLVAESGNTISAEIWFAPELQYLPVRILTRLDEQTFMDMQMDRAPQQTPGDIPPAK